MVGSWVILWFECIHSTRNRVSIKDPDDSSSATLNFRWGFRHETSGWRPALPYLGRSHWGAWADLQQFVRESRIFWAASLATFLGVGMVRRMLVGWLKIIENQWPWSCGAQDGEREQPAILLPLWVGNSGSLAVSEIDQDETKRLMDVLVFFS